MKSKAGDLVLIYMNNKPSFFARIEKIEPDIKIGWFKVTFLMLTVPLRTFIWILEPDQIDGASFTMQGLPVKIEKIGFPLSQSEDFGSSSLTTEKKDKGKIIPLFPKKKLN
ncbi:MAG: hypothetical protein JRI44_04775 [Deltaproteobacteria bacterium]|nr:hypothetical protein [Deltaproteobacteria bacterium]